MRASFLPAAAAAALLAGGPACAGGSDPKPAKTRTVCRAQADTTSRIGRTRTCHSKEEWAQIDQQRLRDTEQGLESTNHQRQQLDTFRNVVGEGGVLPRA
ncbi:MAG: hypothetical protein JO013_16455 [Alphaproteobacteria bacterium]|nr:hypothetical protein [Alphaproteobacteria bacterium]MBV9932518.1 hypothetical protein [Alphaproteobacteria bacterium]